MKVKVFLIVIISVLGLNLYAQLIPDENFKARINQNLGQPPEYEPTIEDLNGILKGKFDQIPEEKFRFIGSVAEIKQ